MLDHTHVPCPYHLCLDQMETLGIMKNKENSIEQERHPPMCCWYYDKWDMIMAMAPFFLIHPSAPEPAPAYIALQFAVWFYVKIGNDNMEKTRFI